MRFMAREVVCWLWNENLRRALHARSVTGRGQSLVREPTQAKRWTSTTSVDRSWRRFFAYGSDLLQERCEATGNGAEEVVCCGRCQIVDPVTVQEIVTDVDLLTSLLRPPAAPRLAARFSIVHTATAGRAGGAILRTCISGTSAARTV